MGRFFIKLILVFLLGILPGISNAQNVFIANDFVACGVGLKDSSGKWLAEPIYQKIFNEYHGYYKVLLGSKEGILDSTGKVVIPAIYDFVYIRSTYTDSTTLILIEVANGEYEGVVNTNHQIIVPIVCRMVSICDDGTIIAQKGRKSYSFYTIKGEETIIPDKLPEPPHALGHHLFEVSKNTFGITIRRKYYRDHTRRWWKRIFRRTISLKHKYGLMNDSLRLIIPKKFSDISYSPGKYQLVNVTKGKKSGYYNLQGKEIWAPVFREDYSFKTGFYDFNYDRLPMINSEGYTKVQLGKKYGLITAYGDTLLPFIYDDMQLLNSGGLHTPQAKWIIGKDKKTGIFDPVAGTWIIPMEYTRLSAIVSYYKRNDSIPQKKGTSLIRRDYNRYKPSSVEMSLLIGKKNGKYGLLTSAGQEILPFIYDDYDYEFGSYFFKLGSTYTSVTVPTYKDTSKVQRYRYYYENRQTVVSICPKNHLFEKVQKENGVILFIDRELLNDSTQLRLYGLEKKSLVVNGETYDKYLHATAVIIKPLPHSKEFPGIGPVYEFENPNLNFEQTDSKKTFCIDTGSWRKIQTVFLLMEDSFHSYYQTYSRSGIYREDGFLVMRPNSYSYFHEVGLSNGLAYFSIDCGRNKVGIIDGNGKLLIDTVWGSISGLKGNHVWVEKKNHRFFYNRYYYDWNILDTTTHQLLLPKKECSGRTYELGKDAAIIDRKEGPKLYNMNTRDYILKGGVNELFKLDSAGNYFAVRTCFGRIGIVAGNGKWLTDTIWTALIHATNKDLDYGFAYYRDANYRSTHQYDYCVLSNDTGWVIFNGYKGTVSHDMESARFLLNKSKNSFEIDSISGIRKFCSDCPSYSYSTNLISSKELLPWQEILLFDSLFSGEKFIEDTLHSWFVSTCADCRKRNPKQTFQYSWSKNYDKESLNHILEFANDSCISVSRQQLSHYYYNYKSNSRDLFFTVMLFDDGPRAMLLDSLFTGTEWKTVMTAEVTNYFESHPNIEGNCHNPYMLPVMLRDRFFISRDGIVLFPPNYKENESQLFVLIPWEKLKSHLRKDVVSKLGLNQ